MCVCVCALSRKGEAKSATPPKKLKSLQKRIRLFRIAGITQLILFIYFFFTDFLFLLIVGGITLVLLCSVWVATEGKTARNPLRFSASFPVFRANLFNVT